MPPPAGKPANTPGTGIADDKVIYSYVPEIAELHTGREAMLENVPTWGCRRRIR